MFGSFLSVGIRRVRLCPHLEPGGIISTHPSRLGSGSILFVEFFVCWDHPGGVGYAYMHSEEAS